MYSEKMCVKGTARLSGRFLYKSSSIALCKRVLFINNRLLSISRVNALDACGVDEF